MGRSHIEHAASMAQSHMAASQVGHYAGISAAGAIQHAVEAACGLSEVGVGVPPLSEAGAQRAGSLPPVTHFNSRRSPGMLGVIRCAAPAATRVLL